MNINDLNIHRRRQFKKASFYLIYLILIVNIYFLTVGLYNQYYDKTFIIQNVLKRQRNFEDFSLIAPKYKPEQEIKEVISFTYDFWFESEVLPRAYSINEHKQLMGLVEITIKLLKYSRIECMIINESLLGSLRNWDVIPWKKNVKIMVNHDEFQKVIGLLFDIKDNDIQWEVLVNDKRFTHNYVRISLKDMNGNSVKTSSMDIHFYEKKSGSIQWEVNKDFPTSHIFPLKMRPFGKYWLPSPNNPAAILIGIYNDYFKYCEPNVLCESLKAQYSFVEQTCVENGVCIEKLELNSIIIGQIEYHD